MTGFLEVVTRMSEGAAACGALGAAIGETVVSGVSALNGTVTGPAGTFFGTAVGNAAGASVGRMAGAIIGVVGGLFMQEVNTAR